MKRITPIALVLLLTLILVACGGQAVPTVMPTAVPVEAPAEEPTPTFESAQVPEGTTPLDTMEFTIDPNLVNINWAWTQRTENGGQEILITVPNPGDYTLFFNENATFNAKIDCNNASGAYASDGNGNIYMELGPMTMAACPPDSLADDMINMFGPAQSYVYEEDGDTLIFKWAAGGPWDYYEKVSQDLAGSSWEAISYNNGKGGVVSLIIGTQITAVFGEDGELTGNASCNDYFGPYEADGENISMGPFGTTRKACPEPEGIMEQESGYLAALETAATYKIDGDTMNMRTAEGSTVANFQRVTK